MIMPYAIMRFAKRKGGPATAMEKHHERKKEIYSSNPDIDRERTSENYHVIAPRCGYYGEIQNRIEAAKCKVRSDSVKFIDTLITASPEFFTHHTVEEAKQYFERAMEFIKQEVGEENIFSAIVHMDERTPHMHLCFVPLTVDKRLSAKDIIGNRQKLVEWQDKFHEHMSAMFPELERGEPAMETKRKHIPVRLFKQATRLTEEMAAIKTEMQSINTFNAGKKKDNLLDMLLKWYKNVNSFNAQIESIKKYAGDVETENKQLGDSLFNVRYRLDQTQNALNNLQIQHNDYREFVETIPQELLEELQERYEEMQGNEQGLSL
jgi:regulator of replication initiation timing